MRTTTFISFLLVLCFTTGFYNLKAQCPAIDTIKLNSQVDVDAFVLNYPNCSQITGDLEIAGLTIAGSDISDLSGLSSIISIDGTLEIRYNHDLTTLDGLQNLSSIGGKLRFIDNTDLVDFASLTALNSIGSSLELFEMEHISSFQGLENLLSIGGTLSINRNDDLTNLSGLTNLNSLGGLFVAFSNLNSLSGTPNLSSFGGMSLVQNGSLYDLDILNNIQSISGGIYLQRNHGLNTIDLKNLEGIGGSIIMEDNNSLSSITGQNKLEYIGGDIVSEYNYGFNSISGFEKLKSIGGDFEIINDFGFENFDNIGPMDSLSSIGGNIELRFTELSNLNVFENVKSLGANDPNGGSLILVGNFSLTSLDGLRNICSIDDELFIQGNFSLTDCAIQSICDKITNPGNSDITVTSNASGCGSANNILSVCTSNSYDISTTSQDQCSTMASLNISASQGNNNEFINILDSTGDIICAIDANGNDLGNTNFELFLSSANRSSSLSSMNRDINITPTNQPTSPVRLRLFYTANEFAALATIEPNVQNYADVNLLVTDDSCDGIVDDGELFYQSKSGDYNTGSIYVELSMSSLSTFHGVGCVSDPYYVDADGDGYGDYNDPGQNFCYQNQGSGYVTNNLDCEDSNGNSATLQLDNIPLDSGLYEAIVINSKGVVELDSVVDFKATYKIVLESGFTTINGCEFSAVIDTNCGAAPLLEESDRED